MSTFMHIHYLAQTSLAIQISAIRRTLCEYLRIKAMRWHS